MSKTEDVEYLLIEALEEFAKQENIPRDEAAKLFEKKQISEKISENHEYFHQLPLEDCLEYVFEQIDAQSRDIIVFHGTTSDFDSVDLSRSQNRRDFGKGFYTTVLEEQAKSWGKRQSSIKKTKTYFVNKYVLTIDSALKIKRFTGFTTEWLEFVKDNRNNGGLQHDYDVVIGPVADDSTMRTIQLYISQTLTADEALKRLAYSEASNQISLHTEKALSHLRFAGKELYE